MSPHPPMDYRFHFPMDQPTNQSWNDLIKLIAKLRRRLRNVETANVIIFGTDAKGIVTEWNQTAWRLTGYTKGEMVGSNLIDTCIASEFRGVMTDMVQKTLKGTETGNFECSLVGKCGHRIDILLNTSPWLGEDDSIVGMLGVGQDITSMKAAEKNHRCRITENKNLIDGANAPIFGVDANGMVTEWNQMAERLSGYAKDEVLGKHLVDTYITPEYQRGVRTVFEDALMGTGVDNFEFPLVSKDQQRVEILLNASSCRDADGTIVGVLGVGQDITGMKAAEKQTQLVVDDLTRLIDGANAPIFGVDANGMVTEWNQTAERLTGYAKDEVLGKHLVDTYITPEYQQCVRTVFEDALMGTEVANFEFPLFSKDQQRVEILLNASSRRDANGTIVGVLGVGQDITGMKVAEKERDQAKSDYLAFICHELRNPLNGINGLVDLCLHGESVEPETIQAHQDEQLDLIKGIKTSVDLMKKVVDDVLDFSKLQANSMELETIDFDIHRAIRDCEHMLRTTNSRVTFIIDIDADVPRFVNGDPTRYCQVVLNLLSNAMKFTLKGSVTLSVRHQITSDGVLIYTSIIDSGIGMDSSYMGVLFQPYSQEKASNTRQYGGTGLGLPICKSIVERMGGTITVQSELHRGSTFTFTAAFCEPQCKSPQSDGDEIKKEPGIRTGSGIRIMLVEDNAINQKIVKRLLEREKNVTVDVFSNGLLAVHAMMTGDRVWDVVLMDVFMPVKKNTPGFDHIHHVFAR